MIKEEELKIVLSEMEEMVHKLGDCILKLEENQNNSKTIQKFSNKIENLVI